MKSLAIRMFLLFCFCIWTWIKCTYNINHANITAGGAVTAPSLGNNFSLNMYRFILINRCVPHTIDPFYRSLTQVSGSMSSRFGYAFAFLVRHRHTERAKAQCAYTYLFMRRSNRFECESKWKWYMYGVRRRLTLKNDSVRCTQQNVIIHTNLIDFS